MTEQTKQQLLSSFPAKKILVVGDVMLDEYIWGDVNRISPEAPVPVVTVQKRSYSCGGAATRRGERGPPFNHRRYSQVSLETTARAGVCEACSLISALMRQAS